MDKTTNTLNRILKKARPETISEYIQENGSELLTSNKPFANYFRMCIKAEGMHQQDVFINADISEGYGYKLISEEKHTKQRDTILRLCFGAHLSLEETQRALKIYGMSPLYPRLPRDAVLMVAFNSRIYELSEVNTLLLNNHFDALKGTDE